MNLIGKHDDWLAHRISDNLKTTLTIDISVYRLSPKENMRIGGRNIQVDPLRMQKP